VRPQQVRGWRFSISESVHPEGDTALLATIQVLVPDLDRRGTLSGYPLIGRMRGLAELRGVMAAFA
jgi:D-mannonate dehydratase